MPLPTGLRRANINATLQGGEIMTHSLWYRLELGTGGGYPLQDHADRIRTAWAASLLKIYNATRIADMLHFTTQYRDVTLYDIDPITGRTSDLASSSFAPETGGTAVAALPTEVACAVTLETGLPGRTRKGRFYLGGFATTALVNETGRLKGTFAKTIAQSMAEFITESRDEPEAIDQARAVVFSRTANIVNQVTRVTVGDVMDVQRRRRNGLVEARQGFEVP